MPAALEALEAFPINAQDVRLVSHSENVTFLVTPRDGQAQYSLRLHRPGYNSLAELNSERLWTGALNSAGLTVPQALLTSSGHHFHPVDIQATDERRFSGMTTWVEGTTLYEYLPACAGLEERKRIYRQFGVTAALTHNQSTHWNEPPGFQRRTLDSDGLMGESPHWGRFWEYTALTGSERMLLRQSRQRVRNALNRYGLNPSTFSLIHADLTPENIVYDGERLAMIDFDDAAFGWHMYDIASALFDERLTPDFEALRDAFIDGYREHRPLQARDVHTLALFLLIRGMAIIGWFHQRPEHHESRYLRELKDAVCAECENFDANF